MAAATASPLVGLRPPVTADGVDATSRLEDSDEPDYASVLATLVPRVVQKEHPWSPPFAFVARPVADHDPNLMRFSADIGKEGLVRPRQRPIEDVLARLEWDEAYSSWRHARVIGYEDRFVGTVEIAWSAWCLAEIPLHRVRYVRNDLTGTMCWERRVPVPPSKDTVAAQQQAVLEAYLHYLAEPAA